MPHRSKKARQGCWLFLLWSKHLYIPPSVSWHHRISERLQFYSNSRSQLRKQPRYLKYQQPNEPIQHDRSWGNRNDVSTITKALFNTDHAVMQRMWPGGKREVMTDFKTFCFTHDIHLALCCTDFTLLHISLLKQAWMGGAGPLLALWFIVLW